MERQILENEQLLVEVNAHGGELARIYDKAAGREILHDADPKYWNRHAPVLFPMVGASFGGEYRYQGKVYRMGQHGFARDSEFQEAAASEENACAYVLTSDEETKKKYPFDFRLTVEHLLEGRKLTVRWTVENTGDTKMLFNIGAHPAFLLGADAGMTDAAFDFGDKRELTYIRIDDRDSGCAYTEPEYCLKTENGRVPVTEDFWKEGVYIFQNQQVEKVTLLVKGKPLVRVNCPGFPYFGIWSKQGNPFICLEPWQGRCDRYGFQGDLSEKEGVMQLEAGGTYRCSYEIEIL